jgi:hypothetical protein
MNPQYQILKANFNWEPETIVCGFKCQDAFDAGYNSKHDDENPFTNDQLMICWQDGQRQKGCD